MLSVSANLISSSGRSMADLLADQQTVGQVLILFRKESCLFRFFAICLTGRLIQDPSAVTGISYKAV
jgi:hypothetical protein